MRLGGDYLWERDVEAGRIWTTLRDYYKSGLWKKRRFVHFLMRKIFRGSDVLVFNTDFQKNLYRESYGLDEGRLAVIKNSFLPLGAVAPSAGRRNDIIFAGRFIKLKNLDALIFAFQRMVEKTGVDAKLRLIGTGPEKRHLEDLVAKNNLGGKVTIESSVSNRQLLEIIAGARMCVLPSFSEIGPNFALECLALGVPILLTRENGLGINDSLPEQYLFDPLRDDLSKKLGDLFVHPDFNFTYKIERSWDDVIKENIKVLCP